MQKTPTKNSDKICTIISNSYCNSSWVLPQHKVEINRSAHQTDFVVPERTEKLFLPRFSKNLLFDAEDRILHKCGVRILENAIFFQLSCLAQKFCCEHVRAMLTRPVLSRPNTLARCPVGPCRTIQRIPARQGLLKTSLGCAQVRRVLNEASEVYVLGEFISLVGWRLILSFGSLSGERSNVLISISLGLYEMKYITG